MTRGPIKRIRMQLLPDRSIYRMLCFIQRLATECSTRLMALVLALCTATAVYAQGDYPTKPVRIILSSGPGGAQDVMARMAGERLLPLWKQNVIVENRTGGGAVIATEAIARATPDGHTLGLLGSTLATNPAVRNDLRYDTLRDLSPILYFSSAPSVLTVRAEFPARTPAEFLALIKSSPGKYAYASPGASTNGHRAMEALKRAAADFKNRMLELDVETFPNTRDATRAFLRRELARWARDAKALGMVP